MNPQDPFVLGPGRFEPQPVPAPDIPFAQVRVVPRRPPVLTAMAVLSIMVAAVSLLAYALMGLGAAGILAMKPPPPPVPDTPLPWFLRAFQEPVPPETDPAKVPHDGLDPEQRAIIIDALCSTHGGALDEAQKQQLDYFLARCGAIVFPKTDMPISAEKIGSMVRFSSGTIGTGQSHLTFMMESGKLTVYQDRVSFAGADDEEPLVTMLGHAPASSERPGGGQNGFGALSAEEARQVVAAVNRAVGKPLNAAQADALQQQLCSPQQRWLEAAYIPAPLSSASILPDGMASIQFTPGRMMTIQADGSIPQLAVEAQIAQRRWLTTEARPYAKVAAFVAVLGLVLAAMLMMGSIEVLREESVGILLHRAWAGLMMFASLGSLAWAWIYAHQIPPGSFAWSKTSDPVHIFQIVGVGLVLLGWIYPIAVLLILSRRAIHEYGDALL